MSNMMEVARAVHEDSKAHGWYDEEFIGPNGRNIPEMLALIHSEVTEALESYRKDEMLTYLGMNGKPEGFGSELADIVIRVFDLAEYLGIDIDHEIVLKAEFNKTRPYRHGGKKA